MSRAIPALTVVIPTFNRREILAKTLAALDRQTSRDFEVVVVDDGSTDGTWSWLQERDTPHGAPTVRTLKQANAGQGAARNRALQAIRTPLVLFLGDDIVAGENLVAEHLAGHAAAAAPVSIVGFIDWRRSEMRVTPALEMANREGHQFGYGQMRAGEVPYRCFYTSNLSIPRALLGEAPFDAAFRLYGWEDIELGYRLHRRGIPLVYRPEARAEHLHPMTLADLYRRQRRVGEAFDTLLQLHPELGSADGFTAIRPPSWYRFAGRWLVPVSVPLWSALDRAQLPLGKALLHRILIAGYFRGLQRTASHGPS